MEKSAMQLMAESEQSSQCCRIWRESVNEIKIRPMGETAAEIAMAATMEKLLKFQVGNFCPACGNKL